jgi:hypothetical protein
MNLNPLILAVSLVASAIVGGIVEWLLQPILPTKPKIKAHDQDK